MNTIFYVQHFFFFFFFFFFFGGVWVSVWQIGQIREKDQLLREIQEENDSLHHRVRELKGQAEEAEYAKQQAENDLKKVLDRREDVTSVVKLVQQALKSRELADSTNQRDENESKLSEIHEESDNIQEEETQQRDSGEESKVFSPAKSQTSTRSAREETGRSPSPGWSPKQKYGEPKRESYQPSHGTSTQFQGQGYNPYGQPPGSITYQHGNASVYTHYVPMPLQSNAAQTIFVPPQPYAVDPTSSADYRTYMSRTVEPVEDVAPNVRKSEHGASTGGSRRWHQRIARPSH